MNCSTDGRYFTSMRNARSSLSVVVWVTRKSGEKSSRPKRRGRDALERNGATSYLARRKIDSTRASAMRLFASIRSMRPPAMARKPSKRRLVRHSMIQPVHDSGTKPFEEEPMAVPTETGLTRREMIVAGSTFAGYAMSVEKVLAQAIQTDTEGLVAGDQAGPVGGLNVHVSTERTGTGQGLTYRLASAEVLGVPQYLKRT